MLIAPGFYEDALGKKWLRAEARTVWDRPYLRNPKQSSLPQVADDEKMPNQI
jgi:hypothetical protein